MSDERSNFDKSVEAHLRRTMRSALDRGMTFDDIRGILSEENAAHKEREDAKEAA